MANLKSAIKRAKTDKTRSLANNMIKSETKTAIKNFEMAFEEANLKKAEELYLAAIKKIDIAQSKGILKKNTAARKKSHLTKKLNSLKEKK